MKTLFLLKKIILFVTTLVLLQSCSKNDDDISYDLTGNWKVIYFIENGNKITKSDQNTWPDFNKGDITANFTEPDSNGRGNISGIRVSNAYNGEYTIERNGRISIENIISTDINEPDWTKLFKINSAENFEIKNSILLISYNMKKNIIAFERN